MTRMKRMAAGAGVLMLAVACGVSGPRPANTATTGAARGEPVEPVASVVCLATVDGTVRMYRLHKERTWMLTMVNPAGANEPVDLPLPGAEPALLASNVRLAYRGDDGLVALSLDSSASGATLDLRLDPAMAQRANQALPEGVLRFATTAALAIPPCRIVPP